VTQRDTATPHLVGVVLALEDEHLAAHGALRPTSAPEIVRTFQARARALLGEAYGAVLDRWGRVPHPEITLGRVVESLAALADGFALRRVVDDDRAAEDAFALTAVRVLEAMSVPIEAG
jgi:hypothetical protein